eukprot:2511967-Prymnesium_polylepis.1
MMCDTGAVTLDYCVSRIRHGPRPGLRAAPHRGVRHESAARPVHLGLHGPFMRLVRCTLVFRVRPFTLPTITTWPLKLTY